MDLIDLTTDEMEVATSDVVPPVVVVKTEPIEIANVVNVVNVPNDSEVAKQRRASRRLELIELARARKAITEFGKTLRKTTIIPEKEATEDTDMTEANSVTNVNTIETVEQAIAESDAAIAANQKDLDEFDD
jgi:hypothetical protein